MCPFCLATLGLVVAKTVSDSREPESSFPRRMARGSQKAPGQREAAHTPARRYCRRTPPASLGQSRKELCLRFAEREENSSRSVRLSQLIVYHFMFGPEWQEGCPSCSFNMDHTDGALVHLAQRDVSFAAVSRSPLSKIEGFKKRMGWKFPWVSSYGTDFNYD